MGVSGGTGGVVINKWQRGKGVTMAGCDNGGGGSGSGKGNGSYIECYISVE